MAHRHVRGQPNDEQIKLLNSIRRGDVLLVDLGGAKGLETKGFHPCVVVSNDTLNEDERTVVVVPITSHGGKGNAKAFEVSLKAGDGELEKDCAAVPHQVRTIDKSARVVEIWGRLSDQAMDAIAAMLEWATISGA